MENNLEASKLGILCLKNQRSNLPKYFEEWEILAENAFKSWCKMQTYGYQNLWSIHTIVIFSNLELLFSNQAWNNRQPIHLNRLEMISKFEQERRGTFDVDNAGKDELTQ